MVQHTHLQIIAFGTFVLPAEQSAFAASCTQICVTCHSKLRLAARFFHTSTLFAVAFFAMICNKTVTLQPARRYFPLPRTPQYRISITVSAQMRAQIRRVGKMMGLKETAAARYLVTRGMENLLHVLSGTSSAESLRSMFEAFERGMEPEPEPEPKAPKIVRVPSNTRTKAQKTPPPPPSK
jgi:hypothetical protein